MENFAGKCADPQCTAWYTVANLAHLFQSTQAEKQHLGPMPSVPIQLLPHPPSPITLLASKSASLLCSFLYFV